MDALLKHMLDVTGHRDHQLLEIAILSAIQQMVGAQHARMLGISNCAGKMMVRPNVWITDGKVGVMNPYDSEQSEEPISNYPVLVACIEKTKNYAKETLPNHCYKLWFPIWVDGKISTCLEIHRTSVSSRKMLDAIEGMLGVYRNFVSLLDYSESDSLTGLLNRKTFERYFSKAQSSSASPTAPPQGQRNRRHDSDSKQQWLAVVDIDHFKHVNDVFGHLYGDEVLILIAQLMNSSFRSQDRIFRFGGEEFVILIHSVSFENVTAIVERFRRTVENHQFPQVGKITVSIGFTSFLPEESPVVILGHADHALYYAKTHGRNQVRDYDELVVNGLLPAEDTVEIAAIEYF